MIDLISRPLLWAKWLTYYGLCGGDYHRYMHLRALAVRLSAERGLYERTNIRFLQSRLRAGDTAVDVGANLGAYSIAFAGAVGRTGTVLAFEPLGEAFEWLRKNTRKSPQVSCYQVALSDSTATELEITVPLLFGRIPEPSLAGLNAAAMEFERRQARVARLDDYLDRISRLSVIKVDIEGHELAFLRGARETLTRFRPLVQFESNDMQLRGPDFIAFAAPLGYSVCALEHSGSLRPIEEVPVLRGNNFYLRPQ